jgi:hypothetical protein
MVARSPSLLLVVSPQAHVELRRDLLQRGFSLSLLSVQLARLEIAVEPGLARPGGPMPSSTLIERFVVAIFRHLRIRDPADSALQTDGLNWFRAPHGASAELSTRPILQRLFRALVERRLAEPGATLTLDALREAVWPEQPMLRVAAANRLHVALASLRRMGLRKVLERKGNGYRLDPRIAIDIAGKGGSQI